MQEKVKVLAAYTVLLFGGGALFYLFLRYLAGVLLPFVLGWGIAMLVRTPAERMHRKTGISHGALRLFLALLFALSLGAVVFFGLRGLLLELSHLAAGLGADEAFFTERLTGWLSAIPILGERLASGDFLEKGTSALADALPDILAGIADFLPSFLFTLGVGVIAAVYFCLDLDRIHAALSRRLPSAFGHAVRVAKDSALRAALSVLRAQGILMLIAFGFLLFGFLLLDVNYPLLLSGIVALLDFLPVLGIGLFLIPWGLLALLSGERLLGIGLLILWMVTLIVRQLAEPHLLGRKYGVHPLLTLLSLYAGGRLFGVMGLFVFPAFTLLLYETLLTEKDMEREKKIP